MTNITTIYPLTRGPLVGIALTSDGESLLAVKFLTKSAEREQLRRQLAPDRATHELHQRAHAQLDGYFAGEMRSFDLPLQLEGTEFQRKVWQQIADIPYGQVCTYGQVAARLGGSGLSRAVGQAANKNPIPLIVPCHRVVGAGGKLTGFASGVELKSYLLNHERSDRLW